MLHYQSDVVMNGAILIALALSSYGFARADVLFALGIGVYILYSTLPEEEHNIILELALNWPSVEVLHDVRTRQSGPTKFIQLHLELDDNLPLVQAHRVADQVEKALLQRFPGSNVIIHHDPCPVMPLEQQNLPCF